ncbi:winged helix DNA-binding domain-containing protein [Cellulomonas fengjieae]|uniref:AlkZ family DNA glycosylase n=1 Tax=Cellulomonas fengjieae TaxID=2819978 RepID=A0ABS3SFL3_9CELL|nr:winged helix DNA-binding domain-containing protein [Cellulomonas fengjieae]MBO3084534.1 AlkZ family DNA glycosylase [Cellulomonas fengjieae]QVI67133.1 AlkZ family DNA glycosylase [Cellulomonas fengjieae]
MDRLEVAHRRLHNQHLSGLRLADPAAVVRHLGASQAQEYTMAKWSLGQRSADADDTAVQAALDAGRILRTHVLRPTWHFVAPEDIRWMLELTGPRVRGLSRYYERQSDIDAALADRSTDVIGEALQGGNHLTRAQVQEALARAGIEARGVRLVYLVMAAEQAGVAVSGAVSGKQRTYALLDERVPPTAPLDPDEALAELTRRFFVSHGPATVKDFAWWASLTLHEIGRGLAMLAGELTSVEVDGLTYWFAPADAPTRDPAPTVHVLQGYDEYGVAYTQGRSAANIAGLTIAPPDTNMVIQPLVLDSQFVGWWRRIVGRDGVVAEPHLAVTLDDDQVAAMRAAFDRLAEFAGVPIVLRLDS